MLVAVIAVSTRSWTARRTRRWWPELLAELRQLAAEVLGLALDTIVALEAECVRALHRSRKPAKVMMRVFYWGGA